MIVESAFLKLLEFLLGDPFPREQYEGSLVNAMAMATLTELSHRGIAHPMQRIALEKPYGLIRAGLRTQRADLFVNLGDLGLLGLGYEQYGFASKNWMEAKFFGGLDRQRGTQTKTEHVADILKDLLRLCLFVTEERSSTRDQGRYLLLAFNRRPTDYLAYSRRAGAGKLKPRDYVKKLLSSGRTTADIDLLQEPLSYKNRIGPSVAESQTFRVELDCWTSTFEPTSPIDEHLYWGYLIRIIGFHVVWDDLDLSYDVISREMWTADMRQVQEGLQARMLRT